MSVTDQNLMQAYELGVQYSMMDLEQLCETDTYDSLISPELRRLADYTGGSSGRGTWEFLDLLTVKEAFLDGHHAGSQA